MIWQSLWISFIPFVIIIIISLLLYPIETTVVSPKKLLSALLSLYILLPPFLFEFLFPVCGAQRLLSI
jgi:hypothetical protein